MSKNFIQNFASRSAVVLAVGGISLALSVDAHAASSLCMKLNGGSIKVRAQGCKATEASLGTFDGTTLLFSGINVQVVSGSGATDGAVNGKGNLIVGYNEQGFFQSPRTGSNNLIVGPYHGYSSYGGLVAGQSNSVLAPFASVSGGEFNSAISTSASVSGGSSNEAGAEEGGEAASISGGLLNTTCVADCIDRPCRPCTGGYAPWVGGGRENTANGENASVSGGYGNSAYGIQASVTGGSGNYAGGAHASVTGGQSNGASGSNASVSGGSSNSADGTWSSVSAGDRNTANANHASVSGGTHATVTGAGSAISGGDFVTLSTPNRWKAGSVGPVLGPYRFASE